MMVMKELISRQKPFAGLTDYQIILAIIQGETPSFSSQTESTARMEQDVLEDICRRCWANDPARRPAMQDIISDLQLGTSVPDECTLTIHFETLKLEAPSECPSPERLVDKLIAPPPMK